MKTTLEDKVTLWKVAAFAELAVLEPRPDLQRLCRAADGAILSPDRIEAVLPGLSDAARRNLTTHCRYLGLLDEKGRLTEAGQHCSKTGEAPFLEQGVYTFWLADHKAFGIELLHVKAEQPDPYDRNKAELVPIDHLLSPQSRIWASVIDVKQRFIVRSLPASRGQQPLGCAVAVAGHCKIRWELNLVTGENRRRLEGKLELGEGDSRQSVPFQLDLSPLPTKDIARLFADWDPRWSPSHRYVAIPYDGLADTQARDSFQRSYRYKQIEVPGQGTFQNVVVHEVPVGPQNAQEAQDWASRLLQARAIRSEEYVTLAQLQLMFDDGVNRTPLESFRPVKPTAEQVFAVLDAKATPEALHAKWRLAAPLDLNWQP